MRNVGERRVELLAADPKGLVRESYRIAGIGLGECRSIFMDWALSLPAGADPAPALQRLIAEYVAPNPGHPMNAVLQDGLAAPVAPKRRGGKAGRSSPV